MGEHIWDEGGGKGARKTWRKLMAWMGLLGFSVALPQNLDLAPHFDSSTFSHLVSGTISIGVALVIRAIRGSKS